MEPEGSEYLTNGDCVGSELGGFGFERAAPAESVLPVPLPVSLVGTVFVGVELSDFFDLILQIVGILFQVKYVLQGFPQILPNI